MITNYVISRAAVWRHNIISIDRDRQDNWGSFPSQKRKEKDFPKTSWIYTSRDYRFGDNIVIINWWFFYAGELYSYSVVCLAQFLLIITSHVGPEIGRLGHHAHNIVFLSVSGQFWKRKQQMFFLQPLFLGSWLCRRAWWKYLLTEQNEIFLRTAQRTWRGFTKQEKAMRGRNIQKKVFVLVHLLCDSIPLAGLVVFRSYH